MAGISLFYFVCMLWTDCVFVCTTPHFVTVLCMPFSILGKSSACAAVHRGPLSLR